MTRVNRSPIPPDMIRQYRDQRYAQQMNESLNNAQARRADIQQTGGISPSSIAMQRAQQANQLGVRSSGLEQAQAGILGQQNAARSALAPRIEAEGQFARDTGMGNRYNAEANNINAMTPHQANALRIQNRDQEMNTNAFTTEMRSQRFGYENSLLGQQVRSQEIGNEQASGGLVTPSNFRPMPQQQGMSPLDEATARLKDAQSQEIMARIAGMLPPEQKQAFESARAIVDKGQFATDPQTYQNAVKFLNGYIDSAQQQLQPRPTQFTHRSQGGVGYDIDGMVGGP